MAAQRTTTTSWAPKHHKAAATARLPESRARSAARRDSVLTHHGVVEAAPIALLDVQEIARLAREVTASFERDFGSALANAEVHHIGATSLPFGHTKGDVDVNVRVDEAAFPVVVDALRERLAVAQPANWTPTFASFSTDAYPLPLGVQVTVIGSRDDFLLALRDRLRADALLLRRYDEIKVATASAGADAYWKAKDALLRELLTD
jgi:GrpB-like predicted nucleotidyltransferase (UPF0157 family)